MSNDGSKLKEYVFENRVNVVHLAKALEVSRTSIYQWYTLEKIPTATKKAIADALGAKLTDVWPYTTIEAMEKHRPVQETGGQVDELNTKVEGLAATVEALDARVKKLESQALRKRPKLLG